MPDREQRIDVVQPTGRDAFSGQEVVESRNENGDRAPRNGLGVKMVQTAQGRSLPLKLPARRCRRRVGALFPGVMAAIAFHSNSPNGLGSQPKLLQSLGQAVGAVSDRALFMILMKIKEKRAV